MNKPKIILPERPKPSLVDAYNGYYGNLKEFRTLVVRFWENRSPMYNDASLLSSAFPVHILPSANNGFMNEFHIRSIKECYQYSDIWKILEFYLRNWKYCEYYIGSEPVYHNECDCYIANILKNVVFRDIKIINPEEELKKRRGRWVHEKLLYSIIESLFPNYTVLYHYRAQWLENLELDIYIEELKIGIEYQGIQHYEIITHWGGADGLKQRQFNDAKKKRLCEEHEITLVYFDYNEPITNAYVKNKMAAIL
jgi:hypothetical protein